MKVITEEKLRSLIFGLEKKLNDSPEDPLLGALWSGNMSLLCELQEIDTLTVSKLRPMCDAPNDVEFLVMLNTEDSFHECRFAPDGRVSIGAMLFKIDYCIGWIPKPIYKPELAGDGE